jgi:hypothetical protein
MTTTPVDNTFLIELPSILHADVLRAAAREGLSLDAWAAGVLREAASNTRPATPTNLQEERERLRELARRAAVYSAPSTSTHVHVPPRSLLERSPLRPEPRPRLPLAAMDTVDHPCRWRDPTLPPGTTSVDCAGTCAAKSRKTHTPGMRVPCRYASGGAPRCEDFAPIPSLAKRFEKPAPRAADEDDL